MATRWKTLTYNGIKYEHYQISTSGDVKSLPRTLIDKNGRKHFINGGIKKARTNHIEHYLFVDIPYKTPEGKNRCKSIYIHKAMWETFRGPTNGKYVTFINGDTFDFRLENLKLITHSELQIKNMANNPERRMLLRNHNIKTGYYDKLKGKLSTRNNPEWVRQIKELANTTDLSIKEIAYKVGCSYSMAYKYTSYERKNQPI